MPTLNTERLHGQQWGVCVPGEGEGDLHWGVLGAGGVDDLEYHVPHPVLQQVLLTLGGDREKYCSTEVNDHCAILSFYIFRTILDLIVYFETNSEFWKSVADCELIHYSFTSLSSMLYQTKEIWVCQRRDRRCQKSADGGKIRQIGIGLWGSRGQKVRQKGAKMGTEDGTERGQKVGQKGDRRWDRMGTEVVSD